jgi:hypothetical protein
MGSYSLWNLGAISRGDLVRMSFWTKCPGKAWTDCVVGLDELVLFAARAHQSTAERAGVLMRLSAVMVLQTTTIRRFVAGCAA